MTVISTAEAALRLGVSRQRVAQFICDGRLPAEWVGAWAIDEAAVEQLAITPRPSGWKKGRARSHAGSP